MKLLGLVLKKQTASLGLIKWHDLKDNSEDLYKAVRAKAEELTNKNN